MPVCVYLPYALCLYLTCTHTHIHFFFPSVFPILSQGFRYVAFHFFLSRAFSGAALTFHIFDPVHPSLLQSTTWPPSIWAKTQCSTHTHTHKKSLTSLFLCPVWGVASFHVIFPPLSLFLVLLEYVLVFLLFLSVSPSLSHMGRTLLTLSCADLYDSSIIVLRTC